MKGKVEMSLETYTDIIDTSKEYEEDSNELKELLGFIFENAELGYNGDLKFYKSDAIMDFLKIREDFMYKMKVEELKMKEEVEE